MSNKANISKNFRKEYKGEVKLLKAKYEVELKSKNNLLATYRDFYENNQQQNANLINIIEKMAASQSVNIQNIATSGSESMSESYQSKYDQRNANNQFVDTAQSGSEVTLNQNISPEQKQNLAEAAVEIQQLLKQLEQSHPTTSTSEQMLVAAEAIKRIESNPSLKKRAINAAKEGGLAAFEKAIDNPAGAFIVGAIKGWQEAETE